MVKVTEGNVAAEFGIMQIPTLAYFRRGTALIYEGDLTDPSEILGWLTSNEAFELPGEIEEVNRRMLEKILDDSDFVAVYFCKQSFLSLKIAGNLICKIFLAQMKTTRDRWKFSRSWNALIPRRTTWTSCLCAFKTQSTPRSGVSPKFQLLCTFDENSQAYTKAHLTMNSRFWSGCRKIDTSNLNLVCLWLV